MDGDLRPHRRSVGPEIGHDAGWGYSTTLPYRADARPPAPRREPPQRETPERERKAGPEAGAEKPEQAKPPMPRWKKALYWLVGLAVLAALVIAGTLYWLHARHFENTDDAFIDGHMSQISAQIGARVTSIAVEDNQMVRAGQLLLELDPRDSRIRLDQARAQRAQAAAQLDQARAGILLQKANLDQSEAQVRVAEAELGQQQTDLARYRAIDPKAITRQQLDTASAQTRSAAARLDASRQAVQGARAQVEAQKAQVEAAEANLQVADVAIANAGLQLTYATVTAPQDGRVTRRTVALGNYVNPGQALLAIVPTRLWVTANFKETQLADMKPGQPVRVRVDACPGIDIAAKVDSFQSGTGAVFSSLPAENATGNYVKVVQRVPVKIVFDKPTDDAGIEECRIAPGLSVAPRVTVR